MKYIKNFKKFFEGLTGKPYDPRWKNTTDSPYKKDKIVKHPSKIQIANKKPTAKNQYIQPNYINVKSPHYDKRKKLTTAPYIIQQTEGEVKQEWISNIINNKILDITLKHVTPYKRAAYSEPNDLCYVLYTFLEGARDELVDYGFARKEFTDDHGKLKFDDPVFIFLNTVKGGTKYSDPTNPLIRGRLQKDLVTPAFILDVIHESSRLLKDWWTSNIGNDVPLGIFYPESSNMAYPRGFTNKSLNKHWAEKLSKYFGKYVSYSNGVPTATDVYVQKEDEIQKKRGEQIQTAQVNTQGYSKGDFQKDEEGNYIIVDDEYDPEVVPQIRDIERKIKIQHYEEDEKIPIKDIPPINRWRLSEMFVYNFINEELIANLIRNRENKILLIDDNIVTGSTLFDVLNELTKIQFNVDGKLQTIKRNQVVVMSMFDGNIEFKPGEKEHIINKINQIERLYKFSKPK